MKKAKLTLVLIVLIMINACKPTYSSLAYDNALKAKQDVLNTVELSINPYGDFVGKIDSLKLELNSYYTYELERPNNKASVEIWKRLIKDKGVVTKFFELWKTLGVLRSKEVETSKKQIGLNFDQLIELEQAKQ